MLVALCSAPCCMEGCKGAQTHVYWSPIVELGGGQGRGGEGKGGEGRGSGWGERNLATALC